jgi:hypothetical protein
VKRALLFASMMALIPLSFLWGRDSITFYQMGQSDPALFAGAKKYFLAKGYGVSVYEGADSIEKQLQTGTRINKERGGLFLAMEIVPAETENVFIAVSNAKRVRASLLAIEEVPGTHVMESEELAGAVASLFEKKVKKLPLFVFLGIDRPGLFLRIDVPADKTEAVFDKLNNGIQNYLKRGVVNENEQQGQ